MQNEGKPETMLITGTLQAITVTVDLFVGVGTVARFLYQCGGTHHLVD